MCHCGYQKFDADEDDGCCCGACNCLCKCIKKTCCCCCKCTGCVFQLICSILSIFGVFIAIYILLMAFTDSYLDNGVWRDKTFDYPGYDDDDPVCKQCKDIEGLKAGIVCAGYEEEDVKEVRCNYTQDMYFYSKGGSGFLGATLKKVTFTGPEITYEGHETIYPDFKIVGGDIHLAESNVNRIFFEYDFKCPLDNATVEACENGFHSTWTDINFISIDAKFWDFMPMGPGSSFGIAERNTYTPCTKPILDDNDNEIYKCKE